VPCALSEGARNLPRHGPRAASAVSASPRSASAAEPRSTTSAKTELAACSSTATRATGAASRTRPEPSGTRPGWAHPRAEQVSRLTALAHAPGRPGRPVDGAHQPAHAQRSSRENGAAPGEESELRSPRSAAGHVGGQAPSARELPAPVRPLPGPPVLPAPVGRLRKP
jgi:hypothetical protein